MTTSLQISDSISWEMLRMRSRGYTLSDIEAAVDLHRVLVGRHCNRFRRAQFGNNLGALDNFDPPAVFEFGPPIAVTSQKKATIRRMRKQMRFVSEIAERLWLDVVTVKWILAEGGEQAVAVQGPGVARYDDTEDVGWDMEYTFENDGADAVPWEMDFYDQTKLHEEVDL